MSSLGFQQQQTTSLNQHVIASLNILQMPQIEVEKLIDQALLDNPLLSIQHDIPAQDEIFGSNFNNLNNHTDTSNQSSEWTDRIAEQNTSLLDHLLWQVEVNDIPTTLINPIKLLIHELTEEGYLNTSLTELSREFNVPIPLLEKALNLLQSFDPLGVGASGLIDCLQLQLNIPSSPFSNHPDRSIALKVLEHPDWLANYPQSQLDYCNTYSTTPDKTDDAISLIRSLNPTPGSNYTNDKIEYLYPDLWVNVTDGNVNIQVKPTRQVIINKSFLNQTLRQQTDKSNEASAWIAERKIAGESLIKALGYRQDTLTKLAVYLTERQRDYFLAGLPLLRPTTITEAADTLNISTSTLSRAANNKVIQSPKGCELIRQLFSSPLPSQPNLTNRYAKHCIKQLIKNESIHNPYSDQHLLSLLREQGISLSRRTLTKYRLAMDIPNSRQRKLVKETPYSQEIIK